MQVSCHVSAAGFRLSQATRDGPRPLDSSHPAPQTGVDYSTLFTHQRKNCRIFYTAPVDGQETAVVVGGMKLAYL